MMAAPVFSFLFIVARKNRRYSHSRKKFKIVLDSLWVL